MGSDKISGWGRRDFFQVAAAAGFVAAAPRAASAAQPSETEANVTPQPTLQPGADTNTSDIVVETLIDLGRDPRIWHRRRRHQFDHRSAEKTPRSDTVCRRTA
jgi:hypothetical protein